MVGDSEKVHSKLSKKSSLAELAEISDFHNQRPHMGSNWNLSILRTTTFTLIFTSHLF